LNQSSHYLVDDDEQRLVVLRPRRARLLQRQQLVDLEIAGAGGGSPCVVSHDVRPGQSISVPAKASGAPAKCFGHGEPNQERTA
jgi:hypothetical protein